MSELLSSHTRLVKAALALAAGSTILSCSPGESTIPTVPATGIEMLDRKLDLSSLVGATAVDWAECPEGEKTKILPEDMRAWGYVYPVDPQNFGKDDKLYPIVWIANVHSYQDERGQTLAWCGAAYKSSPDEFSGPPLGTTVVIPRKNSACDPTPPAGQVLPMECVGEGSAFDSTPETGEIPLKPAPSTVHGA